MGVIIDIHHGGMSLYKNVIIYKTHIYTYIYICTYIYIYMAPPPHGPWFGPFDLYIYIYNHMHVQYSVTRYVRLVPRPRAGGAR